MTPSTFALPHDDANAAYLTLGYTLTVSHQLKLQNLTEFITKDEDFTVIRGGFGNIWKCTYRMGRERMNVRSECCIYQLDSQFSDRVGRGEISPCVHCRAR
jgi:hypothetical protein